MGCCWIGSFPRSYSSDPNREERLAMSPVRRGARSGSASIYITGHPLVKENGPPNSMRRISSTLKEWRMCVGMWV